MWLQKHKLHCLTADTALNRSAPPSTHLGIPEDVHIPLVSTDEHQIDQQLILDRHVALSTVVPCYQHF